MKLPLLLALLFFVTYDTFTCLGVPEPRVSFTAPERGVWIAQHLPLDVAWRVDWAEGQNSTSRTGLVVTVGLGADRIVLPASPQPGDSAQSPTVERHAARLQLRHAGRLALVFTATWQGATLLRQKVMVGVIAMRESVPTAADASAPAGVATWYDVYATPDPNWSAVPPDLLDVPPVSLTPHPGFVGPRSVEDWLYAPRTAALSAAAEVAPTRKPVLVVAAVGGDHQLEFAQTLGTLCGTSGGTLATQQPNAASGSPMPGLESFDNGRCAVMLFVYDDSDWRGVQAATGAVVVGALGQMKWWYVKRFAGPATVSAEAYSHIVVLDEDARPSDGFDLASFLATMGRHGLDLAQPSHAGVATGTYLEPFLVQQQEAVLRDGVRSNFVECGPFVVVSAAVWPCVWELLQPDLVTGYGYDLLWSPACAPRSTGVLHSHSIVHANDHSASSRPNFGGKAVAEALVLFERMAARDLHPVKPAALQWLKPPGVGGAGGSM